MECKLDIPKISGLKDNELTVGREFYLVCQGEWPKKPLDHAQFVLEPADKYRLKLVSAEFRNPEEVDLKVTSYQTGVTELPDLKLNIGEDVVSLGPVQFSVASVLPPPDPQTKPEPFGPIGPLILSWPIWLWISMAAFSVLVFGIMGRKTWRWWQRRQLIEQLSIHDSSMSALHQLHHSLRKLVREHSIHVGSSLSSEQIKNNIQEIYKIFQLFLTRELLVPADKWPISEVIKSTKRYDPLIYKECSKELVHAVSEFEKALAAKNLEMTDVLRLLERSRALAEKMDRLKRSAL